MSTWASVLALTDPSPDVPCTCPSWAEMPPTPRKDRFKRKVNSFS